MAYKKKMTTNRIFLFLSIYIVLILFFQLDKILFLSVYGADHGIVKADVFNVLAHGLVMDVSVSSYFMFIPGLILLLSVFFLKGLKNVLKVYLAIVSFFCSLVILPDLVLYGFWGIRMDATVFNYLSSPEEVVASVSWGQVLLVILGVIVYSLLQIGIFNWIINRLFPEKAIRFVQDRFIGTITWLVIIAALILPVRGGVTTATMNVSRVYFSDNIFLNHAALNPVFYLLYSTKQSENFTSGYRFMSEDLAETITLSILEQNDAAVDTLLYTQTPNVVFIMLESFGTQLIGAIDGDAEVAPHLNQLISEGVLFTNMYANSFRTDRGITSIMAAIPAQPTMSILKYPNKTQRLPSFGEALATKEYKRSFLYGGDLNFANIRSLLLSQSFTDITMDKDFPMKHLLSKWGAPDAITFEKLYEQVESETEQPYFKAYLSLSSHEPFDVPGRQFEDPYLNSVYYTDSCLGVFINKMKLREDWKNTLIVLVPDHDMRYPATISHFNPERHHIFMLMAGGAVKEPRAIEKICSQTDIIATLLSQLGIGHSQFRFSRNILSDDFNEFAFYTFPNGFGVVSPDGKVSFDCDSEQWLMQESLSADSLTTLGKAYLQYLYQYLEEL